MQNDEIQEYTQALQAAEEGQLTIDVHEDENDIIIRTVIAGVKPDEIDIHVTPDLVTIRGERLEPKSTQTTTSHYKEVFWGSFSRSIILPVNVQPNQAKANCVNGILTLTIPKVHGEMRVNVESYDESNS